MRKKTKKRRDFGPVKTFKNKQPTGPFKSYRGKTTPNKGKIKKKKKQKSKEEDEGEEEEDDDMTKEKIPARKLRSFELVPVAQNMRV